MARRSLLTLCLTTLRIDALLAPPARLRHRVRCRASDDEAPEVEEDWRAFRARLVAGGIPTTTDADEPAPAPAPAREFPEDYSDVFGPSAPAAVVSEEMS